MDRLYEWGEQLPASTQDAARAPYGRFQDLLEAMPDAIVIVDHDGLLKSVNAQTERMFGYARSDLLQRPIEVLMPERFRVRHPRHRSEFFAHTGFRPMGVGLELYGQRRDGSEFPVEISLSPLDTPAGHLVAAAIRDISDRRAVQLALQEKNRQLEAAMLAKDRFLAAMSHELRTPLNAVIGFTGALLMRLAGPLTPDQESQLNTVKSSAKHLLALINDLLDVARVESDQPAVSLEPVECNRVVGEVIETLMPAATAKGLTLRCMAPPEALHALADRRALSQILLNLTSNAIKFTARGGVEVRLSRDPEAKAGRIVIAVADSGRGMRSGDLERLFKPFSRIEHNTYQGEGTGLGLYLTKRLVEALGGTIACDSEYGHGSVFTVRVEESCPPGS